MLKYITITILCLLQSVLLRAEEKPNFVFRVEWGSDELGGCMEQDVIVFSIDDLSIIRPTKRDSRQIDYTHFWDKERLRWALICDFGSDFDRKSVVCYGDIPKNHGSVLNIKNMLAKRAFVLIEDNLFGCKYEFYKINSKIIDNIFYQNSQVAESDPLEPGDYLLVVSKIQKHEPLEIRTFSITQEQIDSTNKNFHPVKGSPWRFCGIIKLSLEKMDQAGPELKKQLEDRKPRTSVLSGALNCYYRQYHPLPEYSFEYKEILEFKDPLNDDDK